MLMAMRVTVSVLVGMIVIMVVRMGVIMLVTGLIIVMVVIVAVVRRMGMRPFVAVRSTIRVAVGVGSVLMTMMLVIARTASIVFVFVFVFIRHCSFSRFFNLFYTKLAQKRLVLQGSPVECQKRYSETAMSSVKVPQA